MNTSRYLVAASTFILVAMAAGVSPARAAATPILTLSAASGNMVQVTVSGADAGATVMMNYNTAALSSAWMGLGLANTNGYLTTLVNPGSYGIASGSRVYVTANGLPSASANWPASVGSSGSLALNPASLNLGANQSGTVTAAGATGVLSVSNTNPGVAFATVFGNTLVVTASANTGSTVMTVCDTANNCQTLSVSVLPASMSDFSLSASIANLTVGQSQTIPMTGLGPFSVSQNSNPSAISTAINGNNLVLSGISAGSAVLSVCETNNQCLTVNASTNPSAGSVVVSTPSNPVVSVPAVAVAAQPLPPVLSSVTISTSGGGGAFVGTGTIFTVSFNVNQSVTNAAVALNGAPIALSGSGSGPYMASYTIPANAPALLPVVITFTSLSGLPGQAYLWASNSAMPSSASSGVANSSSATTASVPAGTDKFVSYLSVGSTGSEVTLLQQRLIADRLLSAGSATGRFGALTKAAVQAYQKAHGLSQLGAVGPATRALLNKGI